jgi:hypothetical protein
MVAGGGFWGHNEERATQHQAGGGGDLSVEAVVEDRLGAGEAGGLDTRIEAGRQVNEEDDGQADQAEHEDDSSHAPSPLVAQRDQGQKGGEQRDGNQQERVRLAGGLRVHGRCACRRQPGIARLADFNCPVIDELGDDQAGGRGDDGQADRSLRGEHTTGAGCRAPRPGGESQQAFFKRRQATEDSDGEGAEATRDAPSTHPQRAAQSDEPWPGTLEAPVNGVIDLGGGHS